jgi:hypothetical protein
MRVQVPLGPPTNLLEKRKNRSMIDKIVQYLTDNGMEESEVDHFLKNRIFYHKSVLDLLKEGKSQVAMRCAMRYMLGESWEDLGTLIEGS